MKKKLNLIELENYANSLVIQPKTIVWLSGPLGSGKTTFVRILAKKTRARGIFRESYFFFNAHLFVRATSDSY